MDISNIKLEAFYNVKTAILIPAYKEGYILKTLYSLLECYKINNKNVLVLVLINSKENEKKKNLELNQDTIKSILKVNKKSKFTFYYKEVKNISNKNFGAGYARKLGMDILSNLVGENTAIVNLDADCLVEKNYISEINKIFSNKKVNGISIYFEHQEDTKNNIIDYELFLRYYKNSIKHIGCKYYYHTLGSAMAIRNNIYKKIGGMNKRKAGEDFYFIQKIIDHGGFYELNSTTVFPSSRTSDRVPFGTGKKMLEAQNIDINCTKYKLEFFYKLQKIIYVFEKSIKTDVFNFNIIIKNIDSDSKNYLKDINFIKSYNDVIKNTSNKNNAIKRLNKKINAFFVMKFLNYLWEKKHKKNYSLNKNCLLLLNEIEPKTKNKNFTNKELLNIFRKIDKTK